MSPLEMHRMCNCQLNDARLVLEVTLSIVTAKSIIRNSSHSKVRRIFEFVFQIKQFRKVWILTRKQENF